MEVNGWATVNIIQNIFSCFQQNKEAHPSLEQLEG